MIDPFWPLMQCEFLHMENQHNHSKAEDVTNIPEKGKETIVPTARKTNAPIDDISIGNIVSNIGHVANLGLELSNG